MWLIIPIILTVFVSYEQKHNHVR